MKIHKISGQFSQIGDQVQLAIPADAQELALRLYEETKEIAVFALIPSIQANAFTRTFVAIASTDDLPQNFLKYIGAIGFPDEAFVIEIS